MIGVITAEARNKPTHRKAGRSAYSKDAARTGPAARLGSNSETIERESDLRGEDCRHRRCDHAAAVSHEEPLPRPTIQRSDLSVHHAVGDAELRRGLRVAPVRATTSNTRNALSGGRRRICNRE
jgi:hypothetical protein